jgi:four helix bundle protein
VAADDGNIAALAPVDPGMRQPGVLEGWHPGDTESFGNGKDCVRTGTGGGARGFTRDAFALRATHYACSARCAISVRSVRWEVVWWDAVSGTMQACIMSAEPLGDEYRKWEEMISPRFRRDTLWRTTAYRYAMYLSDLAWEDATVLERRVITRALAAQILRAVGSIGANIADGYGRGSGRDRVRLYEYALCSARESASWYHSTRHALGDDVARARIDFIQRISRLLLATIPAERTRFIKRSDQARNA